MCCPFKDNRPNSNYGKLCNTAIFNPASRRQYIEFNVPYVSVYNSDVWYHSMGNEKRMRKTSMTVQMIFLNVFFSSSET